MVTLWYAEACDQYRQHFDASGMEGDHKTEAMLKALDESFAEALSL